MNSSEPLPMQPVTNGRATHRPSAGTDAKSEPPMAALRMMRGMEAMAACGSVLEATRVALETMRVSFGFAYGAYFAARPEGTLHFALDTGSAPDAFRKSNAAVLARAGEGWTGRAFSAGSIESDELAGDSDGERAVVAVEAGFRHVVSLPLIVLGKPHGVMDLWSTHRASATAERAEHLRVALRLVAIGLERQVLLEAQKDIAPTTISAPSDADLGPSTHALIET